MTKTIWPKKIDEILREAVSKSESLTLEENRKLKVKTLAEVNSIRKQENNSRPIGWRAVLRHLKDLNLQWHRGLKASSNSKTGSKKLTLEEVNLREESIAAKRFEMLFGDLKKIPRVNIPKTDGEKPYHIEVKDPDRPALCIINSPLVGTLQPKEESRDIFRNAIRFAAEKKADAILITGNLLYCLVEKYGKQRPYRTQVVGVVPDPKLLEAAYPLAVLKKIGPLAKRISDKKVIFLTIKVYLDHVFQALKAKFLDENGQPIFKGKVFVTLGEVEEAISMYYANEALRAEVFKEKALAQKEIRELRATLKNSGDREKIIQEINDWQVYERILVLMGNVSPDVINDLREQMTNYLAFNIESVIPNAKVIGIGDTYIKAGKESLSVASDKVANSVRGGLAGRLRNRVYNYVKAHPADRVPEVVLGGGLNPWGTGLYASFRNRTVKKKEALDDVRMINVVQLLPCVDSDLYRETVRRMVKSKDKIAKLASTTNFQSGIHFLRYFEPGPFARFDWYPSDFLTNQEIFSSKQTLADYVSEKDPRSKNVYAYKEGCTHIGASYIARYDSPEDKSGRFTKYHTQVLFEAFMRDDVPIHLYQHDGDAQHWMNYKTFKEGNPQWKDPEDMLKILTEIRENQNLTPEEKFRQMIVLSLNNIIVAGVMQPEDQIELYGKTLAPYCEFFKGVIERSRKAGIVVEGNLGVISVGQGNHNENTFKSNTDVRFSEAKLTRKEIIAMLQSINYNPENLAKTVVACQMGGEGMANGLFRVSSLGDKAYEYCIFMKHKQGSSKVGDNMTPMIKKFSDRGTADDYEEGKFTINLAGDDHMGGHALTRNAFHFKTGGQMFSGPFGFKLDFPKQNLFSGVWSVPAGGPQWGPCSIICFDFRVTRKLAAYKVRIPKELFENPV